MRQLKGDGKQVLILFLLLLLILFVLLIFILLILYVGLTHSLILHGFTP